MGQVAAVGQGQAQDLIAWLDHGRQRSGISLRTGVWLHVGVLSTEQVFDPLNSQRLSYVNVLAATVVAAARVAFSILIGQHGALSFQDGTGCKVFAGNHFQRVALAAKLVLQDGGDFRVKLREGGVGHGRGGGKRHYRLLSGQHEKTLLGKVIANAYMAVAGGACQAHARISDRDLASQAYDRKVFARAAPRWCPTLSPVATPQV